MRAACLPVVSMLLLLAKPQLGAAQSDGGAGGGRELLFTDPTALLPDVYISKTLHLGTEGDTFSYTVVLTHAPGVREDETIDLDNDEVRMYLTSSQDVFVNDDAAGASTLDAPELMQRRNHRTQLRIRTNDIDGDGTPSEVAGPIPYVYKAYSSVNPQIASPIDENGEYAILCPVPTHPAYAELTTTIITDSVIVSEVTTAGPDGVEGNADDVEERIDQFPGCYQIQYNGFAPILDLCAADPTVRVTSCTDAHQDVYPNTVKNPRGGVDWIWANSATHPACQVNLPTALCAAGADVSASTFQAAPAGAALVTELQAGGAALGTGAVRGGDSDYRIYSDGEPVVRDIVDPAVHCRYCAAPGLNCNDYGDDTCPVLTVNGGDQRPEEVRKLAWHIANGRRVFAGPPCCESSA